MFRRPATTGRPSSGCSTRAARRGLRLTAEPAAPGAVEVDRGAGMLLGLGELLTERLVSRLGRVDEVGVFCEGTRRGKGAGESGARRWSTWPRSC